jgi:hypothetical protein
MSHRKTRLAVSALCAGGFFIMTLCACLNFGSWQLGWGLPFGIGLLAMTLHSKGRYRKVLLGAVLICALSFLQSNDPHSQLMFRHLGERLYLPPGNAACLREMDPPIVNPDYLNRFACAYLPAGEYVIKGAAADDGFGPGLTHPLTLTTYYRIDTPKGEALVETNAFLIQSAPDGQTVRVPLPSDRDIIRAIPRYLSDFGRWPHYLFFN